MAHLRELRKPCTENECYALAEVELFSTRNATHGKYCRRHGEEKLRRLQEDEKAFADSQREVGLRRKEERDDEHSRT